MSRALWTPEALAAAGQPFPTRDYGRHIEKLLDFHAGPGRDDLIAAINKAFDGLTVDDMANKNGMAEAIATELVGLKP